MKKRIPNITSCNKIAGLDKAFTPETTLERFQEKIERFSGKIIEQIQRIDNGRLGIPVYFSIYAEDARKITGTTKQMGKGATASLAKASACMELVERFSLFSFRKNPDWFTYATYAEMQAQNLPVIDIKYLLMSVHDQKTSVETAKQLLNHVSFMWTWSKNLTTGQEVLIPFDWFWAINQYNGASSGNLLEEAILQGLCEVIERHVCSIISSKNISTPTIDLNSINNSTAANLIKKFLKNNIKLILKDYSMDTGIPTVAALAWDPSTFPEESEIVYTAGTATNPEKAVIRAVTEVAQLGGDFNTNSHYEPSGLPKPTSLDEVSYVLNSPKTVPVTSLPDISDEDIYKELRNLSSCLKTKDMDVFVVDVTHPELSIPAVYVTVPGTYFRERATTPEIGLFVAKLLAETDRLSLEQKQTRLSNLSSLLPNAHYIYFFLGKIAMEEGNYSNALNYFEKAMHLCVSDEDMSYIYTYTGISLKELGEYKKAIAIFEKVLKIDPERPDIYNLIGTCLYQLKEYQKAIDIFSKAVEINPASAIDWANIGVNHMKLGNFDMAITFLKFSLEIDSSLSFAKERLQVAIEQAKSSNQSI